MSDIKLEIKQVFDAPIEKVWDAWTNPDSLKVWKSPEGMTATDVDVDLKVGGKYSLTMEGFGHKMKIGGDFAEIDQPNKLVYSWLWDGQDPTTHNTTVTVLLKPVAENQTEVTLIHSGFPDQNMADEHQSGWNQTLAKLSNFLRGGEKI